MLFFIAMNYFRMLGTGRFKDTLKAMDDFKNKQKSNAFLYGKVCIFWKCIQYTIHGDKTQMLKKIPSDKVSGKKMPSFFFRELQTHRSFTFNLWFLDELKHKVHLSKSVWGIFHFQFHFFFIKVHIFVQQNAWTLWLSNVILPVKMKIIKKPPRVLLPDLWFLSYNKKF